MHKLSTKRQKLCVVVLAFNYSTTMLKKIWKLLSSKEQTDCKQEHAQASEKQKVLNTS